MEKKFVCSAAKKNLEYWELSVAARKSRPATVALGENSGWLGNWRSLILINLI